MLLVVSTGQWTVVQSMILQQRDGTKISILATLNWIINLEMVAPSTFDLDALKTLISEGPCQSGRCLAD
uniref:Uncharacterized protein n=1 Tax=Caenorhabditis japonica TaxID=281687 RepID=A0A8R1IL41_CAEJA